MTAETHHQRVLIVDFGSQVTQLIARRVREAGVYCEIHPFDKAEAVVDDYSPSAIILSGGPASVLEADSPRIGTKLFDLGVPMLCVCYGEQLLCDVLGGKVEGGHAGEFGRAELTIGKQSPLFQGLAGIGELETVWMSHGDRVTAIPEGFEVIATSTGAPFAAIANDARKIYGVQFHPEVVHTVNGSQIYRNFLFNIAGLKGDWTMAAFRQEMVQKIRDQVGTGKVICGLSGGVDSSVAAVLIHEAIGDQLTCVFVDTGLLRKNEADQVVTLFRDHYNIPLIHVDAGAEFLGALADVSDPETKRKIIGGKFIDIFDREAAKIDGASELATYWKVILPLTKPALATVALFQFLGSWDDFIGPLIYLSSQENYTVSLGLAMFRGQYGSYWGMLMAVSTVMALPIIVLFFFTQRTFIQGITLTGIKG